MSAQMLEVSPFRSRGGAQSREACVVNDLPVRDALYPTDQQTN